MSRAVDNERTKLLATALSSAAVSSFTVGVLAPIAAAFYKLSGADGIALWTIILGIVLWLLAGCSYTFSSAACSWRFEGMSNIELLAFVVLPISVGALAWLIAWANDYFSAHQ